MEQWVQTKVKRITETTLFASDRWVRLFYVLEGTMKAKVGAEIEEVEEGQVLIVNRNKLAQLSSAAGCIVQRIEIDTIGAKAVYPEIESMIFQAHSLRTEDRSDEFSAGRDQIFLSDCLNLIMEEETAAPLGTQGDFILSLLCLEYTVFNDQPGRYHFMSQEKKERLLQVLRYLETHLHERVTLKQAAALANITPQHLSALFKEVFHRSFTDWIMALRLERAEILLFAGELSITEIILECGFSDRKYFYRCFHEAFGCTPLKWRKQWEGAQEKSEELNREAVSALLPAFQKKHELFEKPMDSRMFQKFRQLKKLEQGKVPLERLTVTIDLSDIRLPNSDEVQPLIMFGYDLLMRFLIRHDLALRLVLPIAFFNADNAKEPFAAVTIDTVVVQSLLRFGRFALTRWQVDLFAQNQAEIEEAERIRRLLIEQGVSNVAILF